MIAYKKHAGEQNNRQSFERLCKQMLLERTQYDTVSRIFMIKPYNRLGVRKLLR